MQTKYLILKELFSPFSSPLTQKWLFEILHANIGKHYQEITSGVKMKLTIKSCK